MTPKVKKLFEEVDETLKRAREHKYSFPSTKPVGGDSEISQECVSCSRPGWLERLVKWLFRQNT
jgi:hypothetical protein